MDKKYAVLGYHNGPGVAEGNVVSGVPSGKSVVRTRFFLDGKVIDEDLIMPRLITIEEQVETAAANRLEELKVGVRPDVSALVEGGGNQVEVEGVKNV